MGKITNKEYQELCNVKKRQATDDLKKLEDKGVLERIGITGKGTYYILKGRQRGVMVNDWAIIGQKPHESRNKGATSPRPLPTQGEGKGEGKFQIFFVGIYLAILAIIWQIEKGAKEVTKKP